MEDYPVDWVMDTDQYLIRNLILEYALKKSTCLRKCDLDSLLRLFPLSDDNPNLKKLILLKELEFQVEKKAALETLLYYIAQLVEIELERGIETVSDAMKQVYCVVAVECSLRLLKSWEDSDDGCKAAMKRIWGGKTGSNDKVVNGLDSEELREWSGIIEAAISDGDFGRSCLENLEGIDAIRAVKAFLIGEKEKMGPPCLQLIASEFRQQLQDICHGVQQEMACSDEMAKNGNLKEKESVVVVDSVVLENAGNAGQSTAKVTEDVENVSQVDKDGASIDRINGRDNADQVAEVAIPNVPTVDAHDPINEEPQRKVIHLRDKLVGLRRSTRGHGSRTVRGAKLDESDEMEAGPSHESINLPRDSEVKRVQKALKLSSSDLHAVVMDPLPEALQFAEEVCGRQTNTKGKDAIEENHVGSSSRDDNGIPHGTGIVKDIPRPSMMDRNSTAHTIQWDDSIDDISDEEPEDSRKRHHLCTPRVIKVPQLKRYEPNKKRRMTRRWSVLEEDTLRTGVEIYGRGNWKTILSAYRDVFKERTEVDLKDKWRNLTRG